MNTEQKSILAEKRKKYLTICMASSLILSLLIILPIEIDRSTKYNRAVEEMNKGNYESAIFMFDEIIGYRDSWSLQYDLKKKQEEQKLKEEEKRIENEKIKEEENYYKAIELVKQQKYEEAGKLFQNTSYLDSKKWVNYCNFAMDGNYSNIVDNLKLTEFTVPAGVTSVSIDSDYLEKVNIHSGVTNVYFSGCSNLKSITLPESVTSIKKGAFRNCSGLTSITIPDNVTSIGEGAFYGCNNLESITLPFVGASKNGMENTSFKYIFETSSYYDDDGIPPSLKNVVITGGTTILDYAFQKCSGLEHIAIPNSVTSIGDYAFYGCSGLTSIAIPNSVTSIGDRAFYGCSGLTSISIPNSVTSIGDYAFYDCSRLTSITIPNSVTSIGDGAFNGCSGLTSITIPNSVTSIGDYAFYVCRNLTRINFNGTTAQWNAITKASTWNYLTGSYTIYCIDGNIRRY